ncbi:hypothetical protein GCM10007938_16710 [Vibrio zhanjiangensis]|uniref:Pilus assembly protein, PilO n=1 Tax=Vibrio zhanjiangensis TaxID=1046128 RepID=A0ABQ6EXJ1_9VIBR|nr:type 4a pilus biogenesis protein PilO [Vibrio zhanjiangensis]GLT17893.1 hypothetical protein GCM10007938_16710 [Vibrio zhanjiangensis]
MSDVQSFFSLSQIKCNPIVQCYYLGGYVVATATLLFSIFIYPQLTRLDSLREKETQLIQTLSLDGDHQWLLAQLAIELEELKRVEKQWQALMVDSESLPHAIQSLSRLAEQHELRLSILVRVDTVASDVGSQSAINLDIYGEYQKVMAFFDSVTKASHSIHFDAVSWNRSTEYGKLHVQGHLSLVSDRLGNDDAG